MNHQNTNQINPREPVKMNATCQPNAPSINGTMIEAITAPILVPELKIPVANARSFLGNHSATDLIAAGKLPDSPRPRPERAIVKPSVLRASACAMANMLQIIIEIEYPILVPTRSMSQPNPNSPNA